MLALTGVLKKKNKRKLLAKKSNDTVKGQTGVELQHHCSPVIRVEISACRYLVTRRMDDGLSSTNTGFSPSLSMLNRQVI